MKYFHLTARSKPGIEPFLEREDCVEAWNRLRTRFDSVLACVLMPDHLHLILETRDALRSKNLLMIELAAFAKSRFPSRSIWQPGADPKEIPNHLHLRRQIRYVHLNPCRSGLARDPLEWEWSTHRDVIGAVHKAWVDPKSLAHLWDMNPKSFASAFHRYVSADPTVHVAGTTLPMPVDPAVIVTQLPRIEDAVLQSTHSPQGALQGRNTIARRTAIRVTHALASGGSKKAIARWLDVTPETLKNVLARPPTATEARALQSTLLILSEFQRFSRLRPLDTHRINMR